MEKTKVIGGVTPREDFWDKFFDALARAGLAMHGLVYDPPPCEPPQEDDEASKEKGGQS